MKLSIIVPVFNEEKTIAEVMGQLLKLDLKKIGLRKEIVVVDDGSSDKSASIVSYLAGVKLIRHKQNSGKGAAVRTGIEKSSGDIIIIQDADLEYNPEQIPAVVKPIVDGEREVVYGSRFKGKITGKQMLSHNLGNRLLSIATALLFFTEISDMETCYKAFKRDVLDGIELKSRRFDFEPEVTAKILKKGYKILEVPIDYEARGFEEGKKISVKDGMVALWTLLKYRFSN